ncbi:uncharacterized protein LOC134230236 isoform X2 [Saccostrea cucullata]|uniref:uncharacterized protein LOC134230236 isoform X2 n=1 Tax=Saccostrea cuccullata TaxID=36930 RepID=UPI002ED1D8BE
MLETLVFTLLCCLIQTHGYSELTDEIKNSSSLLDISDPDSKNTAVFRQLLNQETIIRMSLVKNVHTLSKDMLDLKKSMETLETSQQKTDVEVAALKKEVEELKRENQRLALENKLYEETFNATMENFTKVDEYIRQVVEHLEEKREDFETNTSAVLTDLKIEVRYLSVTLLDLNKHYLEIDKRISDNIQEKYEQLSLTLNTSVEDLTNDIMAANNTMVKSVSDLKDSQSSIENSITSKPKNVGFSASVTSPNSSWNRGTLVFSTVITNEGNGYNPSNGIFTAPVDGTYVFFVNVQSYYRKTIYAAIVLNGATKVKTMAHNNYNDAGPNMVVLNIKKGDAVWVRYSSGQGYYSSGSITTFSGFLI